MIITFTNVIGAIRNVISSVITTNLKMWLPFTKAEPLGEELIGDSKFADNGWWNLDSNWDILEGKAVSNGSSGTIYKGNVLNVQKTYLATITLSAYTSGTLTYPNIIGGFLVIPNNINTPFTFKFIPSSKTTSLTSLSFNGSVSSFSLKELTQITPDKSGNNNVGELFTGKALDFDGVNDNVAFTFTTPVKSAVFWVKPLGTGLENILTFGGAFAGTKSIRSNSNVISSLGLSSVSVYVNGVQSSSVPLNQWSRVVVNFASVTPSELKFGFAFNSYGNIQLSNVQLYNENLSTDDIAYDYANPQNLVTDRDGTSIGLSNLKGYWHLSEGAGSLVYDSSGEGNNGTINGATYEPAQPRIPQLGMMNWSKGSNLYSFSEDFENSDWNKNTGTTITNNYATSPNGDLTAARYVGTGFSGIYDTFTLTTNSYTLSFYVKSNTGQNQNCRLILDSVVSSNILVTTDWARISYTQNGSGNPGRTNGIFRDAGNSDVDILIWGAQLEESSSAGAYRLTDGGATLNSTVIPNPTIPTQDIFGNAVRDRLNSFNLDGSGYAVVADDADLDFSGQLTLETWVKADFNNVGSIFNAIYSINGSIAAATGLGFYTDSTKVYYRIGGATNSFTYTQGKWYYLAIIRDSSNNFKFYKGDDGIISEVASGNNTVDFTSTESKFIGKDATNDFSRYYSNLVDDTRAYDRGLTLDEIENNYNAGLSAHTND